MEYTVQKLARLAGVSERTLRFYDEIGLLRPARINTAGYRIYGEREVDALQQILFYRALGLELSTIAALMQAPDFDRLAALREHLQALEAKKRQLDRLIITVTKTIAKEEGSITMTDKEKFEGLKQALMEENERQYGEEIRAKYGEETVKASNTRFKGMDKESFEAMQRDGQAILDRLAQAVTDGAQPDGEAGREITRLHRQWLSYTWPTYSAEAHRGLAKMYLDDARFTAYYDNDMPGRAQFLHDAVHAWAEKL